MRSNFWESERKKPKPVHMKLQQRRNIEAKRRAQGRTAKDTKPRTRTQTFYSVKRGGQQT